MTWLIARQKYIINISSQSYKTWKFCTKNDMMTDVEYKDHQADDIINISVQLVKFCKKNHDSRHALTDRKSNHQTEDVSKVFLKL